MCRSLANADYKVMLICTVDAAKNNFKVVSVEFHLVNRIDNIINEKMLSVAMEIDTDIYHYHWQRQPRIMIVAVK